MGEWAGHNAERAIAKLEQFLASATESEIEQAGVVQAFEFSFEACWKFFQRLALTEGLSAATPRSALGAALKMGIINDEALWLAMLEARNLTSHIYNEALAATIYANVRSRFGPALIAAIATAKRRQP